jgi:DNA-binding MarR family transcriptional regulator
MAELADRVLLSRSGLTRLIDRLQAEGLVRREPSPDDARGTFTVLTADGLNRLRHAAPVHLAGIREHWLVHFSDDELRQLAGFLSRLAPSAG